MPSKIILSFFTIKEGSTSHQASLLPEERGCNRPPVLGTASLYGWRGIKALRHVVRDGTAWGKVETVWSGLAVMGYRLLS